MFKIKRQVIISIFLLVIIIFTSCDFSGKSDSVSTTDYNNIELLAIKDRQGNELNISNSIQTIISLAPSTTRILIELGLENKIVAVDTYSQELISSQNNIKVFDMMNPDIEVLASLGADILFASEISKSGGDDPLNLVRDAKTVVTYIPTSNTIEDIKKDILFIGEATSQKTIGQEIVANMEKSIKQYKLIGESITDKKTVYFELSPSPYMYSFGSDVYLNEMIEIIGAKNMLSNEKGWLNVSQEVIISSNPDIIITNVEYVEDPVTEIMSRKGYENITAVKNKDVYFIDPDITAQPNHYILYGMEAMSKIIYPKEYSLQ